MVFVELIGDELDKWHPQREAIGTVAGMGVVWFEDGWTINRMSTKEKWKDSQKWTDKEMQL